MRAWARSKSFDFIARRASLAFAVVVLESVLKRIEGEGRLTIDEFRMLT